MTALDALKVKVTEVINKIYNSSEILEDVSISFFVALTKELGQKIRTSSKN